MTSAGLTVAVIIPTHNRHSSIERTVRSLSAQAPVAEWIEIIVVADGCSDRTREIAALRWPVPVRVIEQTRQGPAAARNRGAAAATADILIFLDDDVEVWPGFVAAHLRAHAADDPARVVIGYLPPELQERRDFFAIMLRAWWEAMFDPMRDPGHRFSYSDLLSGNFSIRRSQFEEIGGFNELFGCHEDYELGFRLIGAGARFAFAEGAAGWHHERTDLMRALQRKRDEGAADVALARRHPTLTPALPFCRQAAGLTRRGRVLRNLAFAHPGSGNLFERCCRSLLPVLEGARLRTRWRRLLDDLLSYWYWRGVAESMNSVSVAELCRSASLAGATAYDVDLRPGLSAAVQMVNQMRPEAVRLWWGSVVIGTVPPQPGAEPIRGRHLPSLLRRHFARPLGEALAPLPKLRGQHDRCIGATCARHGHRRMVPSRNVMRSRGARGLLFAGWVAWAAFVLAHYYVQLLRAIRELHVPSGRDAIAAGLPFLAFVLGIVVFRKIGRPPAAVGAPRPTSGIGITGGYAAAVLLGAAMFTVPWLLVWPRLGAALSGLAVPALPWFGEAMARLMIAITGASLVGAAIVSAGMVVLRILACRFLSRTEYLIFAAVSGVAVISYASLLLALLGRYRPIGVALLISAALIAGAAVIRKHWPGPLTFETVHWTRRDAPWLALIVVALGYGVIAALAPEKEYDALWYHLYLPRVWLEAGRPVDLLEEYVSLYPLTWELMFAAGMTLGGVVGAKLLHFACLPLLGIVVWLGTRRFLPGVSAPAAVAFVVTTPTVLWESSTAYVDLALTLHVAAAVYALARYAEERERGWGAIAALQFGLGAATKHLGVILTVIALALYVLWAVRSRRSVRQVLGHALVVGLAAAVVPSPWYARSWVASGNPVFPEMFGVFGASPPERWDAATEQSLDGFRARFGMGRSPRDLATLPWDVTVHGASFGGALGPIFLILIPGLLCAPRFRREIPWLAAGVVGYVAIWASPVSSYQLRFLVPIVPALALLAAASFEILTRRAAAFMRHGPALITTAVLTLGLLNLPPFTPFHEADREGWSGWLTHVLRDTPLRVVVGRQAEGSYLAREVLSFRAWQWINGHLPGDVRVLTTAGGDQLHGRRPRLPHDATIARSAVLVGAQELETAAASLRRLGITHVLFDRRELSQMDAKSLVLASSGFQQACTPEYTDDRFWLCRIDYRRLLH